MLGLSKLGFALAALAKERVSKLRRMMKNCSEATSLLVFTPQCQQAQGSCSGAGISGKLWFQNLAGLTPYLDFRDEGIQTYVPL